jgi:hypothetical protein
MPKKRREVKIVFKSDMTDAEYAAMANALWSVAHLSERLHAVEYDWKGDPEVLNRWYDEGGRNTRWA